LRGLEPAPYSYQRPPETDDGWRSADPEEVGLDPQILSGFLSRVSSGEFGDIHSVLLVRHGRLTVEEYFAEDGTRHGPFIASVFRNRLHHLASVSKSVTSILVGAAVDGGLIGSVRDPLANYLPQYEALFDEAKRSITLEHLLTMSSGLEWSQSRQVADHLHMWDTPDVGEYVLRKPLVHEPGTHFVYSNGAAVLVGKALENASGMEVGAYAETTLFGPLGIDDYLWTAYPDGSVETDGGLALRPRDLAKIGQLVLNEGEWEGTRIVSEDWIRGSTQGRHRFAAVDGEPLDYGYFWIQTEIPFGRGVVRAFFHGGDGCQFLGVIPDWNMVVVFTAGLYGIDPNRFYHALIAEYLGTALLQERSPA
jgi:CubicO group peptidase (beta-lactamase class C family)